MTKMLLGGVVSLLLVSGCSFGVEESSTPSPSSTIDSSWVDTALEDMIRDGTLAPTLFQELVSE